MIITYIRKQLKYFTLSLEVQKNLVQCFRDKNHALSKQTNIKPRATVHNRTLQQGYVRFHD